MKKTTTYQREIINWAQIFKNVTNVKNNLKIFNQVIILLNLSECIVKIDIKKEMLNVSYRAKTKYVQQEHKYQINH